MARQNRDSTMPPQQASELRDTSLLVIASTGARAARLASRLRRLTTAVQITTNADEARRLKSDCAFDAIIVHGEGMDAPLLVQALAGEDEPSVLVVHARPSVEDCVEAIRAGACDLLTTSMSDVELAERVLDAVRRSRRIARRLDRVKKLRRVAREMDSAHQQVAGQVGELCEDLVSAYAELSEQVGKVCLASEFAAAIRPELDVEEVLRTTLEFLLAKAGPTNGAIFLPDNSGEFSLGAYVNYDCPKDTSEMLFEHLASAVAPRFESRSGVTDLAGEAELEAWLERDASWLEGNRVLILSCHADGDCLAVVTLFRDRRSPFDPELVSQLDVIGSALGAHLGRVVTIHHRHLPKHKWGLFDPPADDDWGMAA